MADILYIHAADLRLGSPLVGLDSKILEGKRPAALKDLTYIAFERLINLCEILRPDFLLLQGIIYDPNADFLNARLTLHKACNRLAECQIPVFIFPEPDIITQLQAICWPENTKVFGEKSQTCNLEKEGKPEILIHWPGFCSSSSETLPITKSAKDCFQLGILPHSLKTAVVSADFLETLCTIDLDAWAISGDRYIFEKPFITSPGWLQGLNNCENGPAGCMIIHSAKQENRWQCKSEFKQLASLQWENLNIHTENRNKQAENLFYEELEDLRANIDSSVNTIIASVSISGDEYILYENLSNPADDLYEKILTLRLSSPAVLINFPLLSHQNEDCLKNILSREDLAGETARLTLKLLKNPENLEDISRQIMREIYKDPLSRYIVPFDESQLKSNLLYAQSLCMHMLEKR